MYRKHYVRIAAVVATIADEQERARVAKELAAVCKSDNSQFKTDKFLAACNVKG